MHVEQFAKPTILLVLAVSTASASDPGVAARTEAVVHLAGGGPGPRPTAAVLPLELARRQEEDIQSIEVWQAQDFDGTCGYVSASPDQPLRCDPGDQCVFVPEAGSRMCCGFSGCRLAMTCLDAEDAEDSSRCDEECLENQFIQKCGSAAPYCRIVAYPSEIVDIACFADPGTDVISADFTHSNWSGEGPFTTTTLVVDRSNITEPITSATDGLPSQSSESTGEPESTTTPDANPEDANGSEEQDGQDEEEEDTDADEAPGNAADVVRGTAGGLFAFGIAILVAIY